MDEEDALSHHLKNIANLSYSDKWREMYLETKAKLDDALNHIKFEKAIVEDARNSAFHTCTSELRAARSSAPRDAHIYFDEAIKSIEARMNSHE